MSICVNLRYTGKDGNARKFAEEMMSSGTVQAIREEKGNIRYEYYFPLEDPETVLLIDEWEDQEAIDVHHASPMMKTLADLRNKYDLHMSVNRYLSEMQIKPSYLSVISGITETKLNDLLDGLQDADESEMVKIAQGIGKDVHFFMADTINISSISRFDETKYSRRPTKKQKLLSSSILEFLKNVDEVMSAKIRFENIAKN